MRAWAVIVAVAALSLAAGSFLTFIRYELRPRHARLDPTATGLPLESVVIPSSSGASLAGWYLPGAGRGAVLLLHSAKSNRLVMVDRMRFLRDAGYSTLAIDFQAHGESTGDQITLGRLELPRRTFGSRVAACAFARRTRGGAWDIDGRRSGADRTADRR